MGDKANGRDIVWWPSGNVAREALFVMGAPSGTWKFYNAKGQAVGEGTYQNGKRWMGTFIGSQIPGADFFLTKYPMKMEEFDSGILINEKDFLEELGEQ